MSHDTYERPRERLRRSGASALTLIELIQVIVGSGNSKASSARIAKRVAAMFDSNGPRLSYEELTNVVGIGDAKACLILAALEMSARLHTTESPVSIAALDTTRLRKSPVPLLLAQFVDASGIPCGEFCEKIPVRAISRVVARMYGEALTHNTRSITIAVGYKKQRTAVIDTEILEIAKKIYDSSKLLEMKIDALYLVSAVSTRSIQRGNTV